MAVKEIVIKKLFFLQEIAQPREHATLAKDAKQKKKTKKNEEVVY